ncbi:hypothetical protein [Nesterenkonia ebinurensis]|uniref:hypothetical protein n=1 Tax=Nesterenkonia ebinurensis TaxID=2608252 RepID=UPI00123D4E0C|nr:hypothetical protein [Nesterenkonia ebinurensis]
MSMLLLLITMGCAATAVLVLIPPRSGGPRGGRALRGAIVRLRTALHLRAMPRPADLRKDAAELLRQFSALLASGRGEAQAWMDLRETWRRRDPDHPLTAACQQIVAAESLGAGTAEGLRRAMAAEVSAAGHNPELRGLLNRLLAVTALSEQTGAPLSELVEQMASSADDSADLAAAVQTAVAGPKLTQLLLILLPVGGLGLGQLMGASPLAALFGGGLGLACLLGGVLCLLVGRVWSARMINAVMRHV